MTGVQTCALPISPFLFSDNCKASSDNNFAFLHFFFLGMVLITVSWTDWLWLDKHSGRETGDLLSSQLLFRHVFTLGWAPTDYCHELRSAPSIASTSAAVQIPSLGRWWHDVNNLGLVNVYHLFIIYLEHVNLGLLHIRYYKDAPDLCSGTFFASEALKTRGDRKI